MVGPGENKGGGSSGVGSVAYQVKETTHIKVERHEKYIGMREWFGMSDDTGVCMTSVRGLSTKK